MYGTTTTTIATAAMSPTNYKRPYTVYSTSSASSIHSGTSLLESSSRPSSSGSKILRRKRSARNLFNRISVVFMLFDGMLSLSQRKCDGKSKKLANEFGNVQKRLWSIGVMGSMPISGAVLGKVAWVGWRGGEIWRWASRDDFALTDSFFFFLLFYMYGVGTFADFFWVRVYIVIMRWFSWNWLDKNSVLENYIRRGLHMSMAYGVNVCSAKPNKHLLCCWST